MGVQRNKIARMTLSLRTSAIFLVTLQLVAESDAVWKPKGNMHAHESPEYLFRQGDTNKDDVLSADELKEFYKHDEDNYHGHEIAKHFGGEDKATAALDLDNNGVIDASEFLDYASPAHALAVAMDDFDLVDANGDKVLDLEEYKKTHYGKERVIGGAHDGFMQHHDEVDVNKDGKITKEEWLAPDSPARMDPFSHMDYNKDKLVTFEEFSKNEREHYHGLDFDSPESKKHTREAFDILDCNKDGKLTRAEDRSTQPSEAAEYEKMKYDDEEEEEEEEEEEKHGGEL